MNYNKIPTIVLNNQYTKVENRERILEYLKNESNISKIEAYVEHNALVLKNNPHLKIEDVVQIMEYSNYRINKLKGVNDVAKIFEEVKKDTSNLSNIEVIYTPYFMNDKNKNGFRYGVTYVKIRDELYEVRNIDKVMSFIGNKELIKDLSEYEIIKFLKENSDLIQTNYLDRNNGEITTEMIDEEIEKESDKHIRDALLAHKNDVVKEREKLEEYLSKNIPGAIVRYGVNSNEERIYMVEDKMIKFVGKDREMQILTPEEIEKEINTFENNQGYQKDIEEDKYNEIADFIGKEETLYNIVDKLYREEDLTNEEFMLLTSFLSFYIDSKEQNLEVNESLDYVAEKWYENTSIDRKYPTEELEKIYERIRVYRKNKVKIYEFDNLNDKAFISTFAILESSLILGLIVALIMLFK